MGIVSEEVVLFVGFDSAVRLGVRNASEHEALAHLIIIEEASIRLINSSCFDQAGTSAACASPTGVREVETLFLCSIEHVGTLIAINGLLSIWSNERDFVGSHHDGCRSSTRGSHHLTAPSLLRTEVVSLNRNGSIGPANGVYSTLTTTKHLYLMTS